VFVDSHCHLSFPELHGRIDAIRAEMAAAEVDRALCICTRLEEFATVLGLAQSYDNFWASVGVHPDEEQVTEPTAEGLVEAARSERVVAIGETGLDYYRLCGRSIEQMEWQRERFRVHIRAGRRLDLPLVIHTRSASDDTLAVLRDESAQGGQGAGPAPRGVFHCFTESMDVARAALDLGFHISFSGILTFKNAVELKDVARRVPLDRMLVETDSPYLAPVPYRGKRNQPAFVRYVAEEIARLRGVDPSVIGEATSNNFFRLFGIAHA